MRYTAQDAWDLIEAAAEQHGLDDADNTNRECDDLKVALRVAARLMTVEQRTRWLRTLSRGMLAGWV